MIWLSSPFQADDVDVELVLFVVRRRRAPFKRCGGEGGGGEKE